MRALFLLTVRYPDRSDDAAFMINGQRNHPRRSAEGCDTAEMLHAATGHARTRCR